MSSSQLLPSGIPFRVLWQTPGLCLGTHDNDNGKHDVCSIIKLFFEHLLQVVHVHVEGVTHGFPLWNTRALPSKREDPTWSQPMSIEEATIAVW